MANVGFHWVGARKKDQVTSPGQGGRNGFADICKIDRRPGNDNVKMCEDIGNEPRAVESYPRVGRSKYISGAYQGFG